MAVSAEIPAGSTALTGFDRGVRCSGNVGNMGRHTPMMVSAVHRAVGGLLVGLRRHVAWTNPVGAPVVAEFALYVGREFSQQEAFGR